MSVALGTVQTVVVCVAGTGPAGFCPTGYTESVTQAYLIAPSMGSILDAGADPFDSSTAGAFWGFGFAATLSLYLFAYGCGVLFNTIRKL